MGILHGDPHMENIRIELTTGNLYIIDFGSTIDFGSGPLHLPKYLKHNKKKYELVKKTFHDIRNDVTKWLPISDTLNERTFKSACISNKRGPITLDLLKYTIIKANPKQNGELLTWESMQEYTHYKEGYKWIVDIDQGDQWRLDMNFLLNSREHISSIESIPYHTPPDRTPTSIQSYHKPSDNTPTSFNLTVKPYKHMQKAKTRKQLQRFSMPILESIYPMSQGPLKKSVLINKILAKVNKNPVINSAIDSEIQKNITRRNLHTSKKSHGGKFSKTRKIRYKH